MINDTNNVIYMEETSNIYPEVYGLSNMAESRHLARWCDPDLDSGFLLRHVLGGN